MFTLIHGNRQELLAQHLAACIGRRPLSLFEREVIVVQSGGMARWLQMFLAEEQGLATQLRFTFPAGYLWELFGAVLPDVPKETPFASAILTWQLLRLMPEAPNSDEFAVLQRYLADGDLDKRHGLARRLAECFDSYLAYRPEWVGRWLQGRQLGLGEHEAWQAWLWQQIGREAGELPEAHPAELFFRALEQDADGQLRACLPSRITVFGAGAMPPPYLDIFKRLGQFIEVSFYLVNPCQEHWGELVSRRVLARAALETPEALPLLEVGHPLLGSLEQVTRASFERLIGDNDIDLFVAPEGNTLLATLHTDLLHMHSRASHERLPLAADDASIQFHVCHSPTREIEVLHDRLLALFAADPTLQPHDVLVLTPDIIAVAPLIEAVFATASPGRHALPFTIADRPLELEAPLLRALNALLDLANSRFDAESVLGVLEQPCIAARFGFDDEGLALVRAWVGESGIRWGLSGAARAARDLPDDDTHSWRFGLERMLLGLALPQREGQLFAGVLPFDAIEGVRSQILGRLLVFMEALESAMQQLALDRSVGDWAELLPQLCLRFCVDERELGYADLSTQRALQALRTSLQQLAKAAAQGRCEVAVPLSVMRRELQASLNSRPPSWAFLGGGITFAALRAYRGMPARVVCLLGMNDGVFPRNPAVPGFDLMHKHRQAGDRDLRAEDRHAFFEALLSAREYLHVSYCGRGVRDNAPLPPSMLVAELRDSVDATALAADGRSASAALTVQHRLQPFSARYFDGSDAHLYSHAPHYARASSAAQGERIAPAPFLTEPLTDMPESLRDITPQQFMRFFRNPAEYLLRHRLGIHLEESEGLLETVEPFVPDALQQYQLRNALVDDWQRGVCSEADALALARARGALPHGAAGAVWFASVWQEFAPFAAQLAAEVGEALPPQRVALRLDEVRIAGSIDGLHASEVGPQHLSWRVGKIRPIDKLMLWLHHLLLHASGLTCHSLLLTPQARWQLPPLTTAESAAQLDVLVALYRRGCCSLLPFFPATSLHWLMAQLKERDSNWQRDWQASGFSANAESLDAYVDLAWHHCDPFTHDFEITAGQVYGPLLALTGDDAAEEEGA